MKLADQMYMRLLLVSIAQAAECPKTARPSTGQYNFVIQRDVFLKYVVSSWAILVLVL